MDYYQGVVREFLQADRSIFVHEELIIDLDYDEKRPQGKNAKGRHWICDLAAISQRERTMYLGEVTFNKSLQSLVKRFENWAKVWPQLVESLVRDSGLDHSWKVIPWAFIPKASRDLFEERVAMMEKVGSGSDEMPCPKVTYLEDCVPWKHKEWKGRPSQYMQPSDDADEAKTNKNDNDEKDYHSLSEVDPNLPSRLQELFREVEKLDLMVAEGSYRAKQQSRIVWTRFKVQFRDEEGNPLFERKFNFGVFKPNGYFVNLSLEGDLGRKYSQDLADILPNADEMREGGKVRITDLLSVKDAWLELIRKFLPELKDKAVEK